MGENLTMMRYGKQATDFLKTLLQKKIKIRGVNRKSLKKQKWGSQPHATKKKERKKEKKRSSFKSK